ncbi:sensor histidine kinase [Kitasatospora sp. NPDC085464]|uniref:sensor histidine kinase n=1 Tax=Kitasatospora sp. NPDC085464 TaxID=3364063 RepID=UPI0037C8B1E6
MGKTLWRPLVRGPLGWWKSRDGVVEDAVLALVLTGLAFVPTLSKIGAQIGDLPGRRADALAVVLASAQTLPLVLRRRSPALCLAVVGAAFAVDQALGYPTTFGSLGLYVALYSAGAGRTRFRRAVAGAASAGYVVLAVVLHGRGSPQGVSDYLAFYASLVALWLVGNSMRRRRMAEEERQRLAAEAATAAERARIARELHDVVTHHVTAMVVQADAAQFVLASAPERVAEGLTAVSGTGRRALSELRQLLGVLEATGESATADRGPALGRVTDLVEQARMAGQPVEFAEHGERRPQAVDVELACYRVVQEALTNALKYASGRRTVVLVRHGAEGVEIEVTTVAPEPSAPATPPPVPAGGRGLAGLRERLRMLDGELVTGPGPDGTFAVRALIPSKPVQE